MVSLNLGKHNFWIRRKTNAIISLLAQGSKNSVFLLPAPHTKEKLLDVRSSMNPWDKALCMCVLTSQWTSGCLYVGNTLRQLTLAIISLPTRMVCGHSELEASKGLKRLGKRGNWVLRALSLGGIGEVTQLVHQSVPASAALKLPDPHLAPLPAQLLSQSPDSASWPPIHSLPTSIWLPFPQLMNKCMHVKVTNIFHVIQTKVTSLHPFYKPLSNIWHPTSPSWLIFFPGFYDSWPLGFLYIDFPSFSADSSSSSQPLLLLFFPTCWFQWAQNFKYP